VINTLLESLDQEGLKEWSLSRIDLLHHDPIIDPHRRRTRHGNWLHRKRLGIGNTRWAYLRHAAAGHRPADLG